MVKNGALRILRIGGVDVYIHWSWIIIVYALSTGLRNLYSSPGWVAADITLYVAMVALHETVQLIAARVVGGTVTEMYITFLGRNSNLELPQRPWPIIVTYSVGILAYVTMFAGAVVFFMNARYLIWGKDVAMLSGSLLFFNILLLAWTAAPVYPLDGGKVLQALLWLMMSRKRSLQIACIIGLPFSLGIVALAFYFQFFYSIIWAALIFFQCLNGFRVAKAFDMLEKIPRRTDVACPHCKQHPFAATTIQCPCGQPLDPFLTRGLCPACGSSTTLLPCPICRQRSPIHKWFGDGSGFEVQPITVTPVPAQKPIVPNQQ